MADLEPKCSQRLCGYVPTGGRLAQACLLRAALCQTCFVVATPFFTSVSCVLTSDSHIPATAAPGFLSKTLVISWSVIL